MTPQPIESAPKDGGWVLGLVLPDGPTEARWQTWEPVTWSDGPLTGNAGWYDDDGCPCQPSAWVPFPDPQPRNTGWTPPTGVIQIAEITGDGWTSNGKPITVSWRWIIQIEKPDGTFDDYRECDFAVTIDEAEARAIKWQAKFGLPIVRVPLARKVVQFPGANR